MGIRIFDTDPDAAPRARFADDLVGRLRSGYQANGRPAALSEWRVTSGDPEVLDAVVAIMGATREGVQEWDAKGEDNMEVYTTSKSVDIILDGPDAIRSEMVLWGRSGAIRKCDGVEQKGTEPGDKAAGSPCECPQAYADRKEAAKSGRGCQPSITAYFRLAADPELGRFKFTSGSWSLVRDIGAVEEALAKVGGPARATLALEVVEMKNGKSFTKPVFKILGAAK